MAAGVCGRMGSRHPSAENVNAALKMSSRGIGRKVLIAFIRGGVENVIAP
jgi:hypothetical protein